MPQPKIGMNHSDVRKRMRRISKLDAKNKQLKDNLMNSLANQANIAQEGAGNDIIKEVTKKDRAFSGNGTVQRGIGPGKKLGAGTWYYRNGKWERG